MARDNKKRNARNAKNNNSSKNQTASATTNTAATNSSSIQPKNPGPEAGDASSAAQNQLKNSQNLPNGHAEKSPVSKATANGPTSLPNGSANLTAASNLPKVDQNNNLIIEPHGLYNNSKLTNSLHACRGSEALVTLTNGAEFKGHYNTITNDGVATISVAHKSAMSYSDRVAQRRQKILASGDAKKKLEEQKKQNGKNSSVNGVTGVGGFENFGESETGQKSEKFVILGLLLTLFFLCLKQNRKE